MLRNTKANLHSNLNFIHELAIVEQQNQDKAHIDLKINLPKENDGLIIETDFSKLKHILVSLIKNAFKFSEKGVVNYGYHIITENKDNPVIRFYVEDTGIGITPENQQLIFSTFRQIDDSHTRKYGGIGVGLSISRRLINMLGGEIWLKSEPGVGSTFFFTIPLDINDSTKALINKFHNKLGLIVEDDNTSYQLLKIILEGYGIKTLHATNGILAIENCKKYTDIDIILMDINMPLMNGLEATREIRKFNKDVKIIAQTAFTMTNDRDKAIEAGCDDYVTKPVNKSELIELIQTYI